MTTTNQPTERKKIQLKRKYKKVKVVPMVRIYKIDGVSYQRVTTCLNIINKPAMISWAGRVAAEAAGGLLEGQLGKDLKEAWEHEQGAANTQEKRAQDITDAIDVIVETAKKRPDKEKDEAADRGNEIHDWAERVMKEGIEVLEEVPPELLIPVKGAVAYIQDYGIEIISAETTVWDDDYKVAGTFDLLGWMGDQLVLVDWKSGKGIYWEMALQVAAYSVFHLKLYGVLPDKAHLVQLPRKEGESYRVKTITDIWGAWQTYCLALALHRAEKTIWFEEDVPVDPATQEEAPALVAAKGTLFQGPRS